MNRNKIIINIINTHYAYIFIFRFSFLIMSCHFFVLKLKGVIFSLNVLKLHQNHNVATEFISCDFIFSAFGAE